MQPIELASLRLGVVLSCIAPAAVGLNGMRAIEICNDP